VFPNNSVQLKNLDGLKLPTCTNGGWCKNIKRDRIEGNSRQLFLLIHALFMNQNLWAFFSYAE
jgi:hypothetical protein